MSKDETTLKALLVDDEPFITKGLSVLVVLRPMAGRRWPFSKSTLWI